MKYYLFFLLNLYSLYCCAQNNVAVEKFLSSPGLKNASVGICVKEITGKEIVSYNKKTSLTPASTLKIVTTATVLEVLGSDFKFKTSLSVDKTNSQHIIVKGYGDPTLGSEYINTNPRAFLDIWVSKIKDVIDTTKPVDIEIDDSYFGYNGVSRKWLYEDIGNYYATGAYGISIFDNTYRLFFDTMDASKRPSTLRTEPEMKEISFLNVMDTNTSGQDNGYISGEPFSNRRKLLGDIPAKRKSFSIKGDIPDPGLYLGQTLAKAMAQNNMSISSISTTRSYFYTTNSLSIKRMSLDEEVIYLHESPAMSRIVRVINEKSNNHYTEHLIRAIGSNDDNTLDALESGITKTKEYWITQGLDTDALFMYDGCGLAPSDKVSPELLCDILVFMQTKSKNSSTFLASLPKAGKEGTVRNLLKGSRLEGKVYAKSGSIANVQCFAGYYLDGDKTYAFSVLVNNYNSPRKQVVKAIEDLLLNIF